jgi:hypothetical protein
MNITDFFTDITDITDAELDLLLGIDTDEDDTDEDTVDVLAEARRVRHAYLNRHSSIGNSWNCRS